MKLAISTYSLYRWRSENDKTIEDSIDVISTQNVVGVEFAGLDRLDADGTPKRAAVLRKYSEKKKLEIAGYCTSAELFVPPDKQKEAVERLKREVDVAQALGASKMRHDVTRGFGEWSRDIAGAKTLATVLKTVVPAIREIADYAAGRGVRTSLENHGFYLQTPERVEKLLKAVNHKNFGLTLDMGNFLCAQSDPVAAVKRLVRYAQTVHAKDFHVRDKRSMPPAGWFATPGPTALRGAIVGHGEIDIAAQIKLLRSKRYDGFLSLEFEGMEEPVQAIELGLNYLRGLLA
jgi:sugar phosphate isomerase/epimerase